MAMDLSVWTDAQSLGGSGVSFKRKALVIM